MNVILLAHTSLSNDYRASLAYNDPHDPDYDFANERAAVALTAIRTCYSPLKPTGIIAAEGAKYFGNTAADNEGGTEADRLFRHITRSGHTSTLEHIVYTFAVEGVSRALLAQLTRHRHLSFSAQSQRYVRFGSADKSGGLAHTIPTTVTPDKIRNEGTFFEESAADIYAEAMADAQNAYDRLREVGVSPEDARMVLPQAAKTNVVLTGNLCALLDFYAKRRPGSGAQAEISALAERIREEITKVDPWLAPYFDVKEGAQ